MAYSVINNGGFKFDLPSNPIESRTILSTLIDKDRELIRNEFSVVLTPLVEQIFSEMFVEDGQDDIEFIKSCFVENAETKKNKNEIERLFNDDAPDGANVIPIVNTNNLANAIKDEITNVEIKISKPPSPIVLIGSKGAGKTTFINHLFKFRFNGNEFESHFVVYIDFRRFYELKSQFDPAQLAAVILNVLYDKYEDFSLHSMKVLKRVYFKEIKRNDEGIWEWDLKNNSSSYQQKLSTFIEEKKRDSLEHLTLLSHYLIRERRKRMIVIIDNADQFKDEIQKDLFLFSHSLTKSALCGTVISLREGYYRKWQNSPPFDAYESNIYHITAPRYAEILEKRIDYAIVKAEEDTKTFMLNLNGKDTRITASYIAKFLTALRQSLISIENSSLLEFVNLSTFPNIREGLRIFKVFLNSGHTKVQEYMDREATREKFSLNHQVIPIHEFIKSIALQNRHYYNSETSIIYNLFIPPVDSTDHFIKSYLLMELADLAENKSSGQKYISNKVVIEKFTAFGYRVNFVNSALLHLLNSGLVDTDYKISDVQWDELPDLYNVGITAKGFYYLKNIINTFAYIDLVAQDTPIFDDYFFDKLKEGFPTSSKSGSRNLELRKLYVGTFLDYLKVVEEKQSSQIRAAYGSNLLSRILTQAKSGME